MGLPKPKPLLTVEQYLALERASPERHEFLDGEIYLMAGESLSHGDISFNLAGILYSQLRGTSCRALMKDSKIRSGPKLHGTTRGLYSYPDLFIVCGDPEFHDDKRDVVVNPTAIVEILSPSTEAFDRGVKCDRYQTWNDSLKEYVLVSQDRPVVECFRRQTGGGWLFERYSGLDAVAELKSVSCKLPLRDVYDRVTFDDRTDRHADPVEIETTSTRQP